MAVVYHKGLRTGGPEALHQLVATLRSLGTTAYLVPHPATANERPVPDYAHYGCDERQLDDVPSNAVLVVPEIYPEFALESRFNRRIIWWLSINNSPVFFSLRDWLAGRHGKPQVRDLPRVILRTHRAARLRLRIRHEDLVQHMFQSEYARCVVKRTVGRSGPTVSDFVTVTPTKGAARQPSSIAYNAAKGARFVRRLRRKMPDFNFVPLVRMTPAEVSHALASTAIYLDAGHHPGKDRLPREARVQGCLVIVAKKGAASNSVDVPIGDEFKFQTRLSTLPAQQIIRQASSDLRGSLSKQAAYLATIECEQARFVSEVAEAFNCPGERPSTAL